MQTPMKRPNGLAIRDDGMLFPATDGVLRQANFRPYHGDPMASLEDRLRYLNGQYGSTMSRAAVAAEAGVFNIATAEKDDLLAFVATEYGIVLDGRKSIDGLRNEAIKLAMEAQGGLPAPMTGAAAAALDEGAAPKAAAGIGGKK